ncbi:YgjV family protein [Citrobacter portucalensis]|uniref:YgjV family protein n=1 Tax=Citrobacter portucalensis TaxID=1639133 RepID=UPI003CEEC235
MNTFILSQILAGIPFLLDLCAFFFSKRVITLSILALSTALISIHFWLLNEQMAALLMGIASCRFLVAIKTSARKCMWIFIIISVISCIPTWQSLTDARPLAGSLFMTFAAFQHIGLKLRLFSLMGSFCWLINNVLIGSPVAVVMELAFMGSILISCLFAVSRKEKLL